MVSRNLAFAGAFVLGISWCCFGGVVNFPDPVLEHAVRESLTQITGDQITDEDMLTLDSLNMGPGSSGSSDLIFSLEGLQAATNMRSLALTLPKIDDLTPLAGLSHLKYLDIYGGPNLRDISPIAGLTGLWNLELERTQVTDISALSGMKELLYFRLVESGLSDISPLDPILHFGKLGVIDLSENRISDISVFAGARLGNSYNLCDLALIDNEITDISPLASVSGLRALYLQGNPLNQDAYHVYLPMIRANNPGIQIDVPEPATLLPIMLGAAGLGTRSRSRCIPAA